MKYFIANNKFRILFTLAGALAGFLYWRFIGCASGACALKSVWYWSTLSGSAIGYLTGDLVSEFLVKLKINREEDK